jgi:GNAT superfamily N-acetyltransferase
LQSVAGDLQIVPFGREHLPGVIDLFAQEHWSYAQDEQRAWRALTAPGSLTLIALYDEELAGVAQILSDGEIQAFLAILLVAVGHRRKGIARRLLDETLARTQGQRLDLISCADSFYESLGFRTVSGFRLNRDPS